MPVKELRELLKTGDILIEFTDQALNHSYRWENGMKAYITAISKPNANGDVEIYIYEKEFNTFNKDIEKFIYYDDKKSRCHFSETIRGKHWTGKGILVQNENDLIQCFKVIKIMEAIDI